MISDIRLLLLKSVLCEKKSLNNNVLSFDEISLSECEWEKTYSFFHTHAIEPLFANLIDAIPNLYIDLKRKWKGSIYRNVYTYAHLLESQNHVVNAFNRKGIPIVVLKGTSAAKYYCKPQLRTMGDIDFLVPPTHYEAAVACLLDLGCVEITSPTEFERGRHRSFLYKNVSIELHHFFSAKVNFGVDSVIDNMLFRAMSNCCCTVLPDEENGIVILNHIAQHMQHGVGLRQIIDWYMFVRSCLNDEMWYSSFQEKARITGLEVLAITVTRMCQIYLGLTTESITWCKDADEAVCEDLMQYVIDCGNFGRSRELVESGSTSEIPTLSHPIQLLKHIQSHGEINWKALKKHPYLKPFAWFYQSCRYIKLAFQNKVTPNKLKAIYDEGNKRNEMFAALGLK